MSCSATINVVGFGCPQLYANKFAKPIYFLPNLEKKELQKHMRRAYTGQCPPCPRTRSDKEGVKIGMVTGHRRRHVVGHCVYGHRSRL